MRIAEIYKSIQGEGLLTGTESVFVRASGCNLRCWFCDTPFTSWKPEGEDLAVDEIVRRVTELRASRIVLTGGEPMLFSELIPLSQQLHAAGHHITIETAGTLYLPVACDLMSISPKRANSTPTADRAGPWRARHERTRHAPDVVAMLIEQYEYQLKFVIDTPDDCRDVEQYLVEFPNVDRRRVLLMPQGMDEETLQRTGAWLADYCRRHRYRYCPRMQIEWFGLTRGT